RNPGRLTPHCASLHAGYGYAGALFLPDAGADVADDLPAAAVLLITELVGAERRERTGGREPDLAGRRHDFEPVAARIGLLRQNAHHHHPELFDDGGAGFGLGTDLEAVRGRIGPVGRIGARALRDLLHLGLIEARRRRAADHALHLRHRGRARLGRVVLHRLPARAVRRVEAERRGQIVDAGFLRVGVVAVLALPEEAFRDDLAPERRAVLLLGDVAELLAERIEARVVLARRQRHLDGLVGSGRGRLHRQRNLLLLLLRDGTRRGGSEQGNHDRYETDGTHAISSWSAGRRSGESGRQSGMKLPQNCGLPALRNRVVPGWPSGPDPEPMAAKLSFSRPTFPKFHVAVMGRSGRRPHSRHRGRTTLSSGGPMARDPKAEAALALHRFGLGPRVGSIAAIASDPRGALSAELDRPGAGRIAHPDLLSGGEAARAAFHFRQEERAQRVAQRAARERGKQAAPPR